MLLEKLKLLGGRLKAWCLRLALKVPLVQCVAYFPAASHSKASRKFIFLLVATSLPVLVAAVLTPIPAGEGSISTKLGIKIRDTVTVPELFVYATSFLAPYLFLMYERFRSSVAHRNSSAATARKEKLNFFPGYFLVAAVACLLIIVTAIAFGLMKSDSQSFANSFLFHGFNSYTLWIYLFGLYCWYLTLLDEAHDPAFYGDELGNGGADLANGLAARLAQRG